MGLKKNYFKHLEYGVHSPVKQTDSRNPMSQDYKDAIAAGRNVDPSLVARLDDPRTAEEYYGSFDINPNLELSEPSYLDKGVKFLYDNPIIGKIASKLPIAKTVYKKGTEYMMNKSGGMGGGFTDRELYNPEDEAVYKEEEDALKKKLDEELITEDEYNEEMSYIRPEAYTGSDQVGWKDSDQNIVRHYLDGTGNLNPQTRYSPKSDDYNWQDTYSLKGDDFDKNLDRIDDTSGYQGYTEDKYNVVRDKPLQTYRENFPNVVEQVMANTEDVNMLHPDDIIDSKESGYTDKYNKTLNNSFSDLFGGKTFFGTGAENAQLTRAYLGADLGGMRAGLGADDKLPYMSVWDSYDFQAHGEAGWNKKWAHTDIDENTLHPSDADAGKRDYMQAQLLNRASRDLGGKGGFKIYDRFYFTPDKYKDYIKDNDVEFMKEFYDTAHAGDDQSQWTQPVEINVSKKEEEKTPGTTKFETLKIGQ